MNNNILFFTYGTLMKGEANSPILDNAVFVGKAITKPKYTLFKVNGNYPFPAMINMGNTSVHGELYLVSQTEIEIMDMIENHPYLYCRSPIEIETFKNKNNHQIDIQSCIAYMFVNHNALQNGQMIVSGKWK